MIAFFISLMVFIFAMTFVISQNADEFAYLIKAFYDCRNNRHTEVTQEIEVRYFFADKEIKRDHGSALIAVPTFKDNVIINGTTYSVMKVIYDTDTLDITVILK